MPMVIFQIQFVRNASKEAILKSSDEITPELKAGIQRIKNLQKTFAVK